MQQITIRRPDDLHCHLRDDAKLRQTPIITASKFARALVMPNLIPPLTTVAAAIAYKQRIQFHLAPHADFSPLMTLYLTENMPISTIKEAKISGEITAFKLYPAGVTTNSAAGIKNIATIYPQLEALEKNNLPLCIHGEDPDPNIDIFDREKSFIDRYLINIVQKFPKLRIVFEHVSTQAAVQFIHSASSPLAATITIHHLLFNRNDLLSGGIRPHLYCLPILKKDSDQQALREAALSGSPKFFLGTDSAPHSIHHKENACGCAGVYAAPVALELYTQFFAKHDALVKLEDFASRFGAEFYGLPLNQKTVTLVKKSWQVPEKLPLGDEFVVPLMAGKTIDWSIL